MNRINSLYITNNYNATVYKRKDTKAIVSNPNVQNSRNDGIAALANYNRYENLKITPKLNIPILSPILISDSSCINIKLINSINKADFTRTFINM